MITGKHLTKIISAIMAAAVLGCFLAMMFPQQFVEALGGSALTMEYQEELFGTDNIMQIDIIMEETEWEDMLKNASAEQYYSCDIIINGQRVNNVGIRPKGNTSLSAIVQDPDSDRYSLKLEFDHYVDGQTCLGLDKLILNNNYADATNMKEAIVYDMYQYLGADASLYNYAEISVNGTYWGVYLALEAVEDSFLLRNYGAEDGALYKPDSMGFGGSFDGADFGFQEGNRKESVQDDGESGGFVFSGDGESGGFVFPGDGESGGFGFPEEGETVGSAFSGEEENSSFGFPGNRDGSNFKFPGGNSMPGGRGPSMGGNGSDLNYTDDNLDSYTAIWEGEVNNTGKKDHKRVVEALRHISQGTELEEYLDIDNVLRYMAVHTFAVNMDSLSGNMAHNYYLYEHNGKLNMIPWDYNLSFGGMSMGAMGSASDMVNYAIDTPFQGTDFFNPLLEDEEYCSRYHEYLRKLAQEYVLGGRFQEVYSRIRSRIDALVETDPTAFYSYEEYDAGAGMLYQAVTLRAESILGQLDGSIPSTDAGQRADFSGLVDASAIDISAMGVFNMGGQRFQFNGVEVSFSEDNNEAGVNGAGQETAGENAQSGTPSEENVQLDASSEENVQTSAPTEKDARADAPENQRQGTEDTAPVMREVFSENFPQNIRMSDSSGSELREAPQRPGQMSEQMSSAPENFGDKSRDTAARNAILCAASLALSLAALFAAKHYKRRPWRFRQNMP